MLTGLPAAEVVKAISAPLSACIKGFPAPDSLHPFEAALLDLTIGMEAYQRRLNRVADMRRACVEVRPALASSIISPSAVADTSPISKLIMADGTPDAARCEMPSALRGQKQLQHGLDEDGVMKLPGVLAQVGKGYAARTSKAGSKKEAEQLAKEGLETVALVYRKGAAALEGLKDMAKQLRRLPTVDLELPTVSLPPDTCHPLSAGKLWGQCSADGHKLPQALAISQQLNPAVRLVSSL